MDKLLITLVIAGLVGGLAFLGVWLARVPLLGWLRRQEGFYTEALYRLAYTQLTPRTVAWITAACVPALALFLVALIGLGSSVDIDVELRPGTLNDYALKVIAGSLGIVGGLILPNAFTRYVLRRRVRRLEEQIVSGIQTLGSGVRAGLNLVQAMQLLARNAMPPLSQEIAQLLREYEHGLTLEQAMAKAGLRIGSPTYRLLFSALETHRVRGGNLGETLDRIADAIREIQRLEKHVETLTAEGRSAARMMAIMPFVILLILYFIDKRGVTNLFLTQMGRFMLLAVCLLIGFGFWWIRKIIDIDI